MFKYEWKENLNCDGQHFMQYQQNEPLISKPLNTKRTTTYDEGTHGAGRWWGMHTNVAVLS
jgi:hypothetical protein